MQAFIATIRTATAAATELLIAHSEREAFEDAEKRHNADGKYVLVTIEKAELGPVIIVNGQPRSHEMTMLAKIDADTERRYAKKNAPCATNRRVQVAFAEFNQAEPVLREVELLASYADGYSRVRKANGATAKVHTSAIRPIGAAVSATLAGIRQQLMAMSTELAA